MYHEKETGFPTWKIKINLESLLSQHTFFEQIFDQNNISVVS